MSYFENLPPLQKERVAYLDKELQKFFKNPYIRAGIIATVTKESGFLFLKEITYANTDNARIRRYFGSRVAKFNDAQLTALKKNYNAFFNEVYGGNFGVVQLGNTQAGDGSKFVGRGFNQITGRANYTRVGNAIGVDLVNNPELLEKPEIAAKATANYFKGSFDAGKATIKARYGITDLSQVKDTKTGAKIAHNANMGWKNPPETDPTGGYKLTLERVQSIFDNLPSAGEFVKKNRTKLIVITGAAVAGFFLWKTGTIQKLTNKLKLKTS